LARSTLHLCEIAAEVGRKSVQLEVLDQTIETRSPTGRLLFQVLGAIAEFEAVLRKKRQLEGIVHAQARGALAIAVRVSYNPCPWCEGPGIAHQEELWHTTLARFDSKWESSQSSA
jgi:DNA invertase Pin-like site-specific DNA recombinase